MEPLVIIPVLRPTEPIRAAVDAALAAGCRVLVIDNSEGQIDWAWAQDGTWITQPYQNLGCAGSWNFGIRSSLSEPFWFIQNADATMTRATRDYLEAGMVNAKDNPSWLGVDGDWRVMALNPAFIEQVGWFDERFHPIYMEDCDMEHRAIVAGAWWDKSHPTGATHPNGGGASWKDVPGHQNSQTHGRNHIEYLKKWGGGPRGGERFQTPFNQGEPDRCGPSIMRLRAQQWTV